MHFDKKFWENDSVVGLDPLFFSPETSFSPSIWFVMMAEFYFLEKNKIEQSY